MRMIWNTDSVLLMDNSGYKEAFIRVIRKDGGIVFLQYKKLLWSLLKMRAREVRLENITIESVESIKRKITPSVVVRNS
jgi:hypothetical protein